MRRQLRAETQPCGQVKINPTVEEFPTLTPPLSSVLWHLMAVVHAEALADDRKDEKLRWSLLSDCPNLTRAVS